MLSTDTHIRQHVGIRAVQYNLCLDGWGQQIRKLAVILGPRPENQFPRQETTRKSETSLKTYFFKRILFFFLLGPRPVLTPQFLTMSRVLIPSMPLLVYLWVWFPHGVRMLKEVTFGIFITVGTVQYSDLIHMPKGKPKRGYRRAGGGRPKKTSPSMVLVVVGARSKTLTRCTTKSTVPQLSMGEKQLLQRKIDKLTDDQLDHLLDFLGYSHDNDCEVSIDLDLMEGAQQRVLAKFVDGLCCAAIANLQAKVNRLAPNQLDEVIMFLTPSLEALDWHFPADNRMELTLDWTSLPASQTRELDEFLDKFLNP